MGFLSWPVRPFKDLTKSRNCSPGKNSWSIGIASSKTISWKVVRATALFNLSKENRSIK
jgi:hypothetical protein